VATEKDKHEQVRPHTHHPLVLYIHAHTFIGTLSEITQHSSISLCHMMAGSSAISTISIWCEMGVYRF